MDPLFTTHLSNGLAFYALFNGPLDDLLTLFVTIPLPIIIFVVRSLDLTLSTVRMLAIIHGQKSVVWILGFIEATLFVLVLAGVITNLDDPLNMLAYALGSATGSAFGMFLESKVAPGHSLIRITSSSRGTLLLDTLHDEGLGATEVPGIGLSGTVSVIYCFTRRKLVRTVKDQVLALDPEAFITVHHVRQLGGGWGA
jgi:uncharacterized protein YebE (UPF0316 family)